MSTRFLNVNRLLFTTVTSIASIVAIATEAKSDVLLSWNTFGNTGGEFTEASVFNSSLVNPSSLSSVGISPVSNSNRFGGNAWFDSGDSNPTTLAESIADNDYITFTVTPTTSFTFAGLILRFGWDRSSTGPSALAIRYSLDNYSTTLGSIESLPDSQSNGNVIFMQGIIELSSATTFRLYGYGATSMAGTGGFDTSTNAVNVSLETVPELGTLCGWSTICLCVGIVTLRRRRLQVA